VTGECCNGHDLSILGRYSQGRCVACMRAAQARYRVTDKGKATQARYRASDKGVIAEIRYRRNSNNRRRDAADERDMARIEQLEALLKEMNA